MLNKSPQPIVVTRDELYRRVWSTPVLRLAREFGISDVALAKACRRRNIPLPPRGHWARHAAGLPVSVAALPPAQPAQERPVMFHAGRSPSPSPSVSGSRRVGSSPQSKAIAKSSLHPLADRLRKTLLLSKPRSCGRVRIEDSGLPLVVASPQQATRVAQFFHALLHEAGRKQIDVTVNRDSPQSLAFSRGKQRVQLCIEEDLHSRPGHAFRPSGRLTFQLAVEWKQTADTPSEQILENLVTQMDALLR